mgnify:CR=1 FL=1
MKASKPYFSHDIGTKSDEKIIRLMFDFRKSKNDFPESTLRELVSHAAYGIYWEIIEYLHENSLNVDELDMLADELRIDSEVLKRILSNYELFKIIDGKYISERVLRNLKLQEEKSEKAKLSDNFIRGMNYNPERYSFSVSTYSSIAFLPPAVIRQAVRGLLPTKLFSTSIYPASLSLSNCTLRFPAVDWVFSFK